MLANWTHRRRWIIVVALLGLLGSAVRGPRAIRAQRADVLPIAGEWCGLTASGGTVTFAVMQDKKWITALNVVTTRLTISTGEGRGEENERGKRIPIMDEQFIYRLQDGTMVRARFREADVARGSFTGIAGGNSPKRVVSNFIAWPRELGVCPE